MSTTEVTTAKLLTELATVSTSKKSKKRAKQPKKKLPQKKRSSAKHNKNRLVKETTNLAHITKAIVSEGGTVPDVGVILGCQETEAGREWLERLKAENLHIDEFLKLAKQRADVELVRVATKAALGYTYTEEKEEFEPEIDSDGKQTGKYVLGKRNVTTKRERDSMLLKFLITSRMPEYFTETRRLEIDKRVVEIKTDAEAEIRSFTSGLLKAFGEDVIDTEFVERLDG